MQSTLSSTPDASGFVCGADAPLSYHTVFLKSMTFENRKIRSLVESFCEGRVLNACAGENQLSHDGEIVRNDIDAGADVDSHLDVLNLREEYGIECFDTIVYDPPYTPSRAKDIYQTDFPGYGEDVKGVFDDLLKDGGVVIQLGYTSDGMPLEWGYSREHVGVLNTFGRMFDVVVTVDRYIGSHPEGGSPITLDAKVKMNGMHPSQRRETQQEPVDLHYEFHNSQADAINAIESFLDNYCVGHTLDLFSQPPTLRSERRVIRNHPPERVTDSSLAQHLSVKPQHVDDILRYAFNTVVFSPGDREFFQQMRDGGDCGLGKAIKQQIDPYVAKGGRVIQVGPTTTCMPAGKVDEDTSGDFTRTVVGVFSWPGTLYDLFVTVEVEDGIEYAHDGANERWKQFESPPSGPTQFECIHCGDQWYACDFPALADWPCPECGAAPGTFCIDEISGAEIPANPRTPREGLHHARTNWARQSLESMECPCHDDGHVVLTTVQYLPFQV